MPLPPFLSRWTQSIRSHLSLPLPNSLSSSSSSSSAPPPPEPVSHFHGRLGESAARQYLTQQGYQFLRANFKSRRGEIDLIFSHQNCLILVEVKTRAAHSWTRPANAINRRKRRALERAALDFLHQHHWPRVAFRFDIVEVLLEGHEVSEIRHLPNAIRIRHGIRL